MQDYKTQRYIMQIITRQKITPKNQIKVWYCYSSHVIGEESTCSKILINYIYLNIEVRNETKKLG